MQTERSKMQQRALLAAYRSGRLAAQFDRPGARVPPAAGRGPSGPGVSGPRVPADQWHH